MAVRPAGTPLQSDVPGTIGRLDRFEAGSRCGPHMISQQVAPRLTPELGNRVRELKAIVFEPAGVFYDSTLWCRWLLALLARMGWRSGFRAFAQLLRGDCLQDVYCGQTDRSTALRHFLKSLGLNVGQAEEVLAASTAWRRELDDTLRPLPGVRKAITLLEQTDLQLAILADTELSAAGMRARLAGLGLGEAFAVVVSSHDIGSTKPEKRAYRAVEKALQVDAAQIAFVGQDASDLVGAGRRGWLRIACQHEPAVEADVHLERLEYLANLIQQSRSFAAAG